MQPSSRLLWIRSVSKASAIRCRGALAAAEVEPEVRDESGCTWEAARPFGEIPGPKTYPIVKSIPSFLPIIGKPIDVKNLPYFYEQMYEEYGPMSRIEFGSRKILLLQDPKLTEETLKHGVGKWPQRNAFQYLKKYRMELRKEWYGSPGVAASNGEEWYNIRSKVQQPMMRPKNSLHYIPSMDQVAIDFMEHIRKSRTETGEVATNFSNELYKWALESISLVALNTKFGCFKPESSSKSETQEMIANVQLAMDAMGNLEVSTLKLWRYFLTKDMKRLMKGFDSTSKICFEKINAAKEQLKEKLENNYEGELSILERFLTTPDMSVNDAHTMAMDMLFAGIDTTGNTTGFLLYLLGSNPEVQEKLYKEVSSVLPSRETPMTSHTLTMLPYMKACVKESMRIYPVTVGFSRLTEKDIVLQGYQVPKGVDVVFTNVMSRNENHFPEPLKFKPERWLKGDSQQHTANPFVYMPFGHGPRMCIGRRLAEQEMWVLLTRLNQHFFVENLQEDMGMVFRLVNSPDRPLRFKFLER